ncbi:G-protein coupled receptor [Strongyloides ratti]|uniref:G-protein coupled receptor n=1 Tax=Strongyloides ratti TaxID=34506 RepID=A0A090KVR5_STRRB|nr:G-protein coupled receptor [Strongyloides ratti]CEF59966.1 G-protein coupled receptor [Strongyloides ratti]
MDIQRYAKEIAKTEAIYYLGIFYNETLLNNKCPEKIIFENGYKNCDVINTSLTDPVWLAKPIYGYAVPIVTFISLLTNSMAILILTNKTLRTPTNHILLTMATSELCTAFSSMPWVLYYYTFDGYKNDLKYGMPPFWCKYHPHIWKTIPTLFHTNAIWLTVYLAVQRYFYVCLAYKAQTYCTLKKTKIVVWLIFVASTLSVMPSVFTEENISYEFRPGRYFCLKVYSDFVEMMGIGNFMILSISSRVILVHVMPCIIIIIFTAKLFWTINKQEKKRSACMPTAYKKLSTYSQSRNQNNALLMTLQNKNNNNYRLMQTSTRLLVVVITIFMIIEIPLAFIFMLHVIIVVYQVEIDPFWSYINCLLIIRNFLIIFTYPINFAIYFGMSSSFKEIFKERYFRRYFKKKNVSNNMTNLSSKNRKFGRSLANSHSQCTPKSNIIKEKCLDFDKKLCGSVAYLDVNDNHRRSSIKYRNSLRKEKINNEFLNISHKRLSVPTDFELSKNEDFLTSTEPCSIIHYQEDC